ncbi:unnamed protein product [Notodromas monacha]|uniref:Uncharacterized protein n=1 Tax=Notodromas monacha TaxID=399045 RepID=A0A7R9C0G0_9CRUS|nr:unnamed protein product [Notodromas monacha]CAG0925158.1 unnamed protein product [Notodromas monacha]
MCVCSIVEGEKNPMSAKEKSRRRSCEVADVGCSRCRQQTNDDFDGSVQAFVGILWNVFAIMMYNCEIVLPERRSGLTNYVDFVRERYFYDANISK